MSEGGSAEAPKTFVAEWLHTNLNNPDLDCDIVGLIAKFTTDDSLDSDQLKAALEDLDEN